MRLLTSILILQMLCQFTHGQDVESTQKENVVKELEQQFFPIHKLSQNRHFDFPTPFSEVNVATEDGFNLNGLLFKVKQPKGLIFYLHGSNDAVDIWGKIAPTYNSLNYDIFILDYRGYGKSEGRVTSERQLTGDIQTVYNKLKRSYKESNIIIIGQSMGTGPAANLARNNNPKALILQAPYYSLSDWIYNIAPEINTSKMRFQFKTFESLPKIKVPVIIFHGDSDNAIYYGSSIKLSALFKKGDELIMLKGEGHNNFVNNLEYLAKMKLILQ
jgi:alpha-beta hydrolase superfamily lysophospholipase